MYLVICGMNSSLTLDINECTTSKHNCNKNAKCTNTVGSFTCTCNTGYTGNGVSCNGKKIDFVFYLKNKIH